VRLSNLYEIQSIPLTLDTRVRSLYYRFNGNGHALPVISNDRKTISLSSGCELDLGTYFGSFFECYWRRYTPVTDVFLTFRLQGKIRLSLFRFSPEIREELIYEADLSADDKMIEVPVREPDPYPTAHGRIYARIRSYEDGSVLSDFCWRTPQKPIRDVRLEATMCTYNREKHLAAILTDLLPLQRENLVKEITIINHAEKGLRERLDKFLPEHAKGVKYKLIDQPNTGGAGGMARSILETLDSGTCNFLVRFDDDIRLDPEVMRRLPILLGYIKKRIAIGSHMLNGLNRSILYEAGSQLYPDKFCKKSLAHGLDVAQDHNLNQFVKVDFVDYSAWWCFAAPTKALSRNQLPFPFFFRMDDIEFGIRLQTMGTETVPWAGLAIWHEPFYVNVGAYNIYYCLRNSMFAYAYHGFFNKKEYLRKLRQRFNATLLQFYYHRSWATVKAMEDFIKGPEVLLNWTPESVRQILDEEKTWAEKDLPRSLNITEIQRAEGTTKAPRFKCLWPAFAFLRILSDMLRPAKPNAPLKFVDYWTQWHLWGGGGQDRLAVNHDRDNVCHVYYRDPRKLRQLLFRFWKAYFKILFGPSPLRYKPALEKMITEEFWRRKVGYSISLRPSVFEEEDEAQFIKKAS